MRHELTVLYSKSLIHKITSQFVYRWFWWEVLLGFSIGHILIQEINFLSISICGFVGYLWMLKEKGKIYKLILSALQTDQYNLETNVVIDDKGMSIDSHSRSTTIMWSKRIKLWRYEEGWFFIYKKGWIPSIKKNSYAILPIDYLRKEIKVYILDKIYNAGGKVS